MLARLQQMVLMLTKQAENHSFANLLRRLGVIAGNLARTPTLFKENLNGFRATAQQHADEVASWVSAEALLNGRGGPFDACDLPCWLALAERAGVPSIPARPILNLSEEELALLSGHIAIPNTPATRRLFKTLASVTDDMTPSDVAPGSIDREELVDRLFDAMDDVPEGWMVRSNRCGGSELKALAGVGITGDRAPEVRFGAGLEVGPGWVREGNRRRVNVTDKRTLSMAVEGPGGLTFLARPWIEASRYLEASDPHRENSPFAGKGVWPAEWRVFVENGQVVGVSSYYGWADAPSPISARAALEARRLGQLIVDEALRQKAWPRYAGVELVRDAEWIKTNPDLDHKINVVFGREAVSCTLDFLETERGLVLLEGGPGTTPVGGGHLCAFAGVSGPPKIGKIMDISGVAFRTMPGVLIADPDTWVPGDSTGCILSWEEVEALATRDA